MTVQPMSCSPLAYEGPQKKRFKVMLSMGSCSWGHIGLVDSIFGIFSMWSILRLSSASAHCKLHPQKKVCIFQLHTIITKYIALSYFFVMNTQGERPKYFSFLRPSLINSWQGTCLYIFEAADPEASVPSHTFLFKLLVFFSFIGSWWAEQIYSTGGESQGVDPVLMQEFSEELHTALPL